MTFGDSSGAYPDVDPINAVIGEVWGFPGGVPDWPELDGLTVEQWSFPEQYDLSPAITRRECDSGASTTPSIRCRRSTARSAGVPADELVTLIDATEKQIEDAGVQVASYVAPGDTAHGRRHRRLLHDRGRRRAPRRLADGIDRRSRAAPRRPLRDVHRAQR